MERSFFSLAFGVALILVGLLLSTEQITSTFRGTKADIEPALAQGALLFRFGLMVAGAYVLVLRFLPKPRQPDIATTLLAPASRMQTAIFAGLLIIATMARLYRLDYGIWYDEMLTYVTYMPLSVAEIVSTFIDPNNHLFFSILARLSLDIFGDSVWAFRLPAVAFGVGSIGALYFFARRITSSTVSLFGVALLTFSYHHIWFSQNARGYTALLFFTLLSSSFLLDGLWRNKPRNWVYYAIAAFLGVYTHLTMVFVIISHFIIYAVFMIRHRFEAGWPRWNGLIFGFIPLGLLSILAYAMVLPAMFGGSLLTSGLQGNEVEWTNPIWALMEVVNGMQVGFTNSGIAFVATIILGIGIIDLLRDKSEVVGLFLIPTTLGLLLMTSIGYTLFPRFFFFAMGFGVVVVMHGAAVTGGFLGRISRLPDNLSRLLPTVMCAGIVVASLPALRYVYFPKQNFTAAIDLIESEMHGTDIVVTIGIANFPFNEYYQKGWKTVNTVEELDVILSQSSRTWLVYTMPVHAKSTYPGILTRIDRDYDLVKRFYGTLNGGDVVVSLEKMTSSRDGETIRSTD